MTVQTTRRIGLVALTVVGLAGCGGSGAKSPPPKTLAASTPRGLSYTLEVTQTGNVQCVTSSFRSAVHGQPILDGSHLCGAPALPGHAVLIQTPNSPDSMLTDVTAGACDTVRGGSSQAKLRPLVSRCTAGAAPHFRVTILPKIARLTIVGVVKVPVINFPRHHCTTGICVTPLA